MHLTFTLEPALYFGILSFPRATKAFRYTRLLQVVDIPNQAPYKQEVVAKATGALLQLFISAGYFQADVQVESKFDETYMLANVVFHINLGRRAKVGNVEIRRPEPDEARRLLRAARSLRAAATRAALKPGKSYTPRRVDSAVAAIKRDLANQHRLLNRVRFDSAHYRPETNRADVVLDAEPGPIFKVSRTIPSQSSPLVSLISRARCYSGRNYSEKKIDTTERNI